MSIADGLAEKSRRKLKIILIVAVGIGTFLHIFSTTFKTPRIEGVVLDAETGRPIGDAGVYAIWERKIRGFGGECSGGIEKELRLKTKGDGSFLIPARTMINFIPSPIGIGGFFYMFVYSIGYKNLTFNFFDGADFEGPPKPRYIEFDGVTNGKRVVLRMVKIQDPKAFIQNRREVSSNIQKNEEFKRKEDQIFLERFGKQRWTDEYIQHELAEAYFRMGDYKSALRKLNEILEMNPTRKTKYFEEKYRKYESKFNGRN